jgi:hypothetical protein
MRLLYGMAFWTALLMAAPAHAGGTIGGYKDGYAASSYCSFVENADELVNYPTTRALRDEVKMRYEHAAVVVNSHKAIYSLSPLQEWADQAAIHCAKSYGYLRKPRRWHRRPDYVTLQKCECFYERMIAYGGNRIPR